jgi:hypothetical protein
MKIALGLIVIGLSLTQYDPATILVKSSGPAMQTVRVCARADLKIKEGETDAAMGGVRRTPFILTNAASSACSLEGYPGVELLNKAGAVVKRATKQKSEDPIRAVTLEPGKTAWFALNYNAGGAGYTGKPCPTYARLRVTAPGAKTPFVVRSEIQSCGRTDLEVTPITGGTPE